MSLAFSIANLDSIRWLISSSSAGHTISLPYYSSKPKWNRLYVDICFTTNFQTVFTYIYSFERVSVKIVVEQFYLHMLSLTFVCKIVEGLFVHFLSVLFILYIDVNTNYIPFVISSDRFCLTYFKHWCLRIKPSISIFIIYYVYSRSYDSSATSKLTNISRCIFYGKNRREI